MRTTIEHGRFLEATHCDKCEMELFDEKTCPTGANRVKSFFTWEALCPECKRKELKWIKRMKSYGINAASYENCGYWPGIRKDLYADGVLHVPSASKEQLTKELT